MAEEQSGVPSFRDSYMKNIFSKLISLEDMPESPEIFLSGYEELELKIRKGDVLDAPSTSFCGVGYLEEEEEAVILEDMTGFTYAERFEELNLSPGLLKGLYVNMKFHRPSEIQSRSLPVILTPPYKNIMAQAHNGSGKTTCLAMAMLSRADPNLHFPQALCLCPTSESAIQKSNPKGGYQRYVRPYYKANNLKQKQIAIETEMRKAEIKYQA
ncbi:DEAD-box ATP-dependent RNA helicase 38 [Tanacetum coccineum]